MMIYNAMFWFLVVKEAGGTVDRPMEMFHHYPKGIIWFHNSHIWWILDFVATITNPNMHLYLLSWIVNDNACLIHDHFAPDEFLS